MRPALARLSLGLLLILAPFSAHAANTVFQPIIPDTGVCSCPGGAPDLGCAFQVAQNLLNDAIAVGILIAVLIIAYAGILFIFSPTNPENRSRARAVLTNAIVGLIIVLAGWLVVDFVMKIVYDGPGGAAGKFGPWNEILTQGNPPNCFTAQQVQQLYQGGPSGSQLGDVPSGSGAPSPTATKTVQGSGACNIPQSGNCAPSNLAAFGSAAQQASEICWAESRGVVNVPSGSDRMRNDPRHRSFSFGLFQINLTAHKVAGLDCPSAFNGTNYSATVKNEALYQQCVAAAETASANIAVAVQMKQQSGWGQWSTASECRLAEGQPLMRFALALRSVASSLGLPSIL